MTNDKTPAAVEAEAKPVSVTAQREIWLTRGVRALRPIFAAAGYPIPSRLAVSVGFPDSKKAIGQCWYPEGSASGETTHVFIAPIHKTGADALDTLAHELVHAALGAGFGHGSKFRKACEAIGLTEGKPTQASAGPELRAVLERLAVHLGTFPHDPLKRSKKPAGGFERWIVLESPNAPAYRMEVRPAAVRRWGLPLDPWGDVMVPAVGRAPALPPEE